MTQVKYLISSTVQSKCMDIDDLVFREKFCYLNRSRHPNTFNSAFIPTAKC